MVERPSIRSRVTGNSPESHEKSGPYRLPTPDYRDDRLTQKPAFARTNTCPMPRHYDSPSSERMGRTNSDQGAPPPLPTQRSLRPVNTDVFADSTNSSVHSSPDKYTYDERDRSPSRSGGKVQSRSSSNHASAGIGSVRKQAPPPPPASRGIKKPPPPPPPMKKSALASLERS